MRTLILASIVALVTVTSQAHAQITMSDQEAEAYSLKTCRQNMGFGEVMDSDVRYLITTQCRLERLRSGNGTLGDFRRVSRAIERGRLSFSQLDTSVEELSMLWVQVQAGHTGTSIWSQVLSSTLPSVPGSLLPTLSPRTSTSTETE